MIGSDLASFLPPSPCFLLAQISRQGARNIEEKPLCMHQSMLRRRLSVAQLQEQQRKDQEALKLWRCVTYLPVMCAVRGSVRQDS